MFYFILKKSLLLSNLALSVCFAATSPKGRGFHVDILETNAPFCDILSLYISI